jgi:hypothetical protein
MAKGEIWLWNLIVKSVSVQQAILILNSNYWQEVYNCFEGVFLKYSGSECIPLSLNIDLWLIMLQTQNTHVEGTSINAYIFRISQEKPFKKPVAHPSHN